MTDPGRSATERNKATIRQLLDAGAGRAFDRFDALFTSDTVDHVGGRIGVDWWKQIYRLITTSFPDWTWSSVRLVAEGDLVVLHAAITATHQASALPFLAGLEPRGVAVTWSHHHTFRLVDGRIAEHWATRDDLGVLRQLGEEPGQRSPAPP